MELFIDECINIKLFFSFSYFKLFIGVMVLVIVLAVIVLVLYIVYRRRSFTSNDAQRTGKIFRNMIICLLKCSILFADDILMHPILMSNPYTIQESNIKFQRT